MFPDWLILTSDVPGLFFFACLSFMRLLPRPAFPAFFFPILQLLPTTRCLYAVCNSIPCLAEGGEGITLYQWNCVFPSLLWTGHYKLGDYLRWEWFNYYFFAIIWKALIDIELSREVSMVIFFYHIYLIIPSTSHFHKLMLLWGTWQLNSISATHNIHTPL